MEPANDDIAEFVDFVSPCGAFKLTFDDDGKVAYAYLKKGAVILGDVWLYNRCATPEQPEWTDRRNIPFANSKEFVTEEARMLQPVALDDIRVEWEYSAEQPRAFLYLFSRLLASVGVNEKPGHCRFAAKDSPLAKVPVTDRK